MKIRVATYNIHKGMSYRSHPRVHALKQAIGQFDADVVFLQEVQGKHDRIAEKFGSETHGHRHWPTTAQHEFFAGDGRHSVYGMNAVYDHGHHGNALLSNFPIAHWTNTDISDHKYESRGILHCIVETPEQPVHCYVVHLGLFEVSRRRQTEALVQCVQDSARADEPVIIAGDFNDWRNTLSDCLRLKLGVVEVFDELERPARLGARIGDIVRNAAGREKRLVPARTFPAALPWFRLDRIYVRGFKVEHAEVLHGPQWARLSDHAPIVANLQLA
jgi:endonuclease/exonuclease/phosphatase family metal-dependent hydrolase